MTTTKSPEFEKMVADTFRSIKEDFQQTLPDCAPRRRVLDKSIVEQVEADLDSIIKRHGG